MESQALHKNDETLKCGKAEVTVFHSKVGPALQDQLICVLHSHMTKNPKI